jgi:membrane protein
LFFSFVVYFNSIIFASIIHIVYNTLRGDAYFANIQKMIQTLLFTVLIIAISIALLSVKLLFRKNGSFSSQHIHDSEALRKKGIHCVIDQDKAARKAGKAY